MIHIRQKGDGQIYTHRNRYYSYEIETDLGEKEILTYCRANLRRSERTYEQYRKDYKENKDNRSKLVRIVSEGYYELNPIAPYIYSYKVTFEYIL